MTFEEFENLARLFVIGALDEEELVQFSRARREFGERAEICVREARRLSSLFALSLRPNPPRQSTREKLLNMVKMMKERNDFTELR